MTREATPRRDEARCSSRSPGAAAANPHAAAPRARTARELIHADRANRPIADPYTATWSPGEE